MYIILAKLKNRLWPLIPSNKLKVAPSQKRLGTTDLYVAMAVLVRETQNSRPSRERRGRRDEAEVGRRMVSRRYLGAIPNWALRSRNKYLVFNESKDWKPMEMFHQSIM